MDKVRSVTQCRQLIEVSEKEAPMNKQGFSRGNPPEDCQKLQLWWAEEMQKAGLSGSVAVVPDSEVSQRRENDLM